MFGSLFLVGCCAASALAGATFSVAVLKWKERQVGGAKKRIAELEAELAALKGQPTAVKQ
mgnify:CR=1 FL=1